MEYGNDLRKRIASPQLGDLVELNTSLSASKGLNAVVVGKTKEVIKIKWIVTLEHGLRNGQDDGDYYPKQFNLIERMVSKC